jgi:hypothetical protein
MNPETGPLHARVQALLAQGALVEAEALLRPLLASGRGPLPLWRQLVQAIRPQGRITETLAIQRMLVDAMPGDLAGRFDLAETLLLLGEFERGWREYRYRYSLPHSRRMARKVQRPQWQGEEIPGRTLLIHDEQGFGDTFQFLRLVRLARRAAARGSSSRSTQRACRWPGAVWICWTASYRAASCHPPSTCIAS